MQPLPREPSGRGALLFIGLLTEVVANRNETFEPTFRSEEEKVTESHFIVTERDHAWMYSHRGDPAEPFKTRSEAIEAAIAEATAIGDPAAHVIVQNRDMQQETVWRYPEG
jgi:hypothetical protein